MIDTLLQMVPDYGQWIVFAAVLAACLAVPVPASMLVLTAGSFAAVGDLSLTGVFASAFTAFVIGDLLAFSLARRFGTPLITRLRSFEFAAPTIDRSEALLLKRGRLAVLLSHTILSPTCPYISMLSGTGKLPLRDFALVAIPGAALWSAAYVGLGYTFASQLEQVAQIISNFLGVILIGAIVVGAGLLLRRRWRRFGEENQA